MAGNQQDAVAAPAVPFAGNQQDAAAVPAVPLTGSQQDAAAAPLASILLRRANSARNPGQEEAADTAQAPQKGPDRHNHRR